MALVVEDGSVVTGANSYISVLDATAYFEADVAFADTWTALTSDEQELYLRWATRIIDQKVRWRGTKTDSDSALRWPRTGVYDRDGELIAEDEIPQQLTELVCEMVKFLQTNNPTTEQGVDFIKRVAVDVVEVEYQDGTTQVTTPPIFNQLLTGLGTYPTAGGHAFGRILKA